MDSHKCKVLNMENPGQQIDVCISNQKGEYRASIQHGKIVFLPRGVIEVLKATKVKRHPRKRAYTNIEESGGWFQRYEVIEYDAEPEETPEQKKREKLAEIAGAEQ